jgi:hypothetical protein
MSNMAVDGTPPRLIIHGCNAPPTIEELGNALNSLQVARLLAPTTYPKGYCKIAKESSLSKDPKLLLQC